MNLFRIAVYEIAYYAWWWLAFIAIIYGSARYFGWIGLFGGAAVLSILIIFIDVTWIFADMRQHPENGREADFIFWFGVLCRVALFNTVLLPVSITGLKLRARCRHKSSSNVP